MNDCKNRHTKTPEGYIHFQDWAKEKSKTHRQVKCPDCGLWTIWVKKDAALGDTDDK